MTSGMLAFFCTRPNEPWDAVCDGGDTVTLLLVALVVAIGAWKIFAHVFRSELATSRSMLIAARLSVPVITFIAAVPALNTAIEWIVY